MLIVSGLIGSVCAFLALLCGFSLGRSYEREKQKPNAHALAEERSDDSQQRVVGGKVRT
jgi:hypothetical protein